MRRFEALRGVIATAAGLMALLPAQGIGDAGPVGELRRPPRQGVQVVGGMVVVPAGSFTMGCARGDVECEPDEHPTRTVTLKTFLIDRLEVSQADYTRCVEAGACQPPTGGGGGDCTWDNADRASHPINCIPWEQAVGYCRWVGKRLPTEAEWEKAARGTDGRKYPWGDASPLGGPAVANFADDTFDFGRGGVSWALKGYQDGFEKTAPVGSFPSGASPYGALDMAGNVWEWTADWYDERAYDSRSVSNPTGPSQGSAYVIRGGSFGAALSYMRASSRDSDAPTIDGDHIGFRCARDP